MVETAAASWAAAELAGRTWGCAAEPTVGTGGGTSGAQPGASIPVACGGWAETRARIGCWRTRLSIGRRC